MDHALVVDGHVAAGDLGAADGVDRVVDLGAQRVRLLAGPTHRLVRAQLRLVPDEHRVEEAHFHAVAGGTPSDLGPGTAGTLTWCGGAAWFVRDPQREGDPAALMRWSPADGLSVAYESPAGRAFLSAPRCGGDALTVTAMAEGGDEQVTATVS